MTSMQMEKISEALGCVGPHPMLIVYLAFLSCFHNVFHVLSNVRRAIFLMDAHSFN